MPDVGRWLDRVLIPLMFAPVRRAANWSESLADALARRTSWCPLEHRVAVTIDDCDDTDLINVSIEGVVRGCSRGPDGRSSDLLIELSTSIAYNGRFVSDSVWWLVATSSLHWHRTDRLLFSWAAVRLVDALSIPGATRNRTIGIGRLRLG
jgi:hypothetical protein